MIESGNGAAKNKKARRWLYQGLLLGTRYTYACWQGPGRSEELYDNRRDPHQMVNRAADPRYRAVIRAARTELDKTKNCRGPGACETDRRTWPLPKSKSRVND